MDKLRICFIANPNSAHTRRWVGWFAEQGHEVQVISYQRLRQPWSGLDVHELPARQDIQKVRYLAWIQWTRRIVQHWEPDILHAHQVSGAGWLGAFAGFHPFVVTPWGSDLYLLPKSGWARRWLARHVLKSADMVTADSQDLVCQAVQRGARPDCAHLIQWGVELDVFHPEGRPGYLRQRLGVDQGMVVLSPRIVRPLYNLDTIVAAFPRVRAAVPGTILVLRDFHTDVGYKARLQTLIDDLGLRDGVRWLGELEYGAQVADSYRLADVVVSVPSSDGTPVSVLEAMACGVPVVASDVPSLREWITSGENGFLVPVRDAEALASAIIKVLTSPERRVRFRENNLNLIRERANHHKEMAKMENLYYSLLGKA